MYAIFQSHFIKCYILLNFATNFYFTAAKNLALHFSKIYKNIGVCTIYKKTTILTEISIEISKKFMKQNALILKLLINTKSQKCDCYTYLKKKNMKLHK